MNKIKMICNWDKDYKNIITQEKLENGDLDLNSWWYLDGELEKLCGYDKATIYNLSEFPEIRKETLDWESIFGDIASVRNYEKHYEIYANGEYEVEVYGIEEPCIAIFWVTRERLVRTGKGIKFKVWDQRGLVCLKSDTKAIERARENYMKRSENL